MRMRVSPYGIHGELVAYPEIIVARDFSRCFAVFGMGVHSGSVEKAWRVEDRSVLMTLRIPVP